MMSHPNEALIDTLARTWNSHDVDRLLTLFTPDCHYEDMAMGAVNSGHAGLRQFATEVLKTMPDFRLEFPKRFATDTHGASHWIITATWNGPFEDRDASGKRIRFTGLSWYEFRGGKVAKNYDCWDFTVMMKAFGTLRADLRALK